MPVETELSDRSPFPAFAADLRRTVDAALLTLQSIDAVSAAQPLEPGKWSAKETIGHLIDSAANNLQRFVRAQEFAPTAQSAVGGGNVEGLIAPEYAQDHWVERQGYAGRRWDDLTHVWHAFNHHLAHAVERIPEQRRGVLCTIGSNAPVTLGFLVHDYLVHMRHHLDQISSGRT